MWGRPAVPNMSARPSEIASTGFVTSLPGASTPGPYFSEAAWNSAKGLIPNFASTSTASTLAPPRRSTALTICTQVVAIIPPKRT